MGISRRLLLVVAAVLVIAAGAAAEEQVVAAVEEAEVAAGAKEEAALRAELAQLTEKISALESAITERSQELKSKDDGIAKLEKVIEEKSQKIATLQGEIASLQTKGSVAAEEQAGKAIARAVELEKQIDKLKNDIKAQSSQRATLEARASDEEKKVQELNSKIDSLQKSSNEQKRMIQKTERALKVAEEELMRLQLEATTKSKQLTEAWRDPIIAALAQAGLLEPKDVGLLNITSMACPALPLCPLAQTEAERGILPILKRIRAVFDKVGIKDQESVVMRLTGIKDQESIVVSCVEPKPCCHQQATDEFINLAVVSVPYVLKAISRPHTEYYKSIQFCCLC